MRASLTALVLSHGFLHAQVLRVEAGTEDPALLHFNEVFIQRNGILGIEGQGNVKRDGEPIRQKNEHFAYSFDTAGRVALSSASYLSLIHI